jgi:hypothetical protein
VHIAVISHGFRIEEWAKQDVKKIGAWDYKIVTFNQEDTTLGIQQELQKLGSDRWNCFFVETSDSGRVFYFKKPKRSYLKIAGKVSSLIPLSGDGKEE